MAGDVRAIYERFRPLLLRYRGGAPAGFLAAVIAHESSGNPNAIGDASLGEKGLFQIESSFPGKIGLPGLDLFSPELNIFAGSVEYGLRAIEMLPYSPLGTADNWKLARLGFAIGSGGTRKLIDAATNGRPSAFRGQVFNQILSWANRTGAIAVSSGQPAAKVLARVNAVQDQWNVGQQIAGSYGAPERVPAPKGLHYTVPASAAGYLVNPIVGTLLALGMVGLVIFLATRKDTHGSPELPTVA